MELGFDPARVERLASAVTTAIDALADCRCDDHDAADAMRVVRLTRQNLEDLWMPCIAALRTSTALTSWLPALRGDAAAELVQLFARRPLTSGFDQEVHAAVVAAKMSELLSDPDACLDVLSDPYALALLATWDDLPDELVERFVVAGLRDAVIAEPSRRLDGLRVLATLTAHVNGRFDGRLRSGFVIGVARSLEVSAPLIAPALRREALGYPVIVFHDDDEVLLGSYDDLVDLFGALMRDPAAASEVGRMLGQYTIATVEAARAEIAIGPTLGHVAELTDLVTDAALAEQAELVAEAAADAAWIETFGDTLGFGVGIALTATGVGAITRVLTDRAISLATSVAADQVDTGRVHGGQIAAAVHELVVVTVVRNAVTRPDVRTGLGLDDVSDEHWGAITAALASIDAAPDTDVRRSETLRLESWIDANVPALAGALVQVRAAPGMHELTEARAGRDPDRDG